MTKDELYTQLQVADLMHVSTKTLEAMRQKGTGPRYHKFGRRVLYARSVLMEFLSDRTFGSTAEYPWS